MENIRMNIAYLLIYSMKYHVGYDVSIKMKLYLNTLSTNNPWTQIDNRMGDMINSQLQKDLADGKY